MILLAPRFSIMQNGLRMNVYHASAGQGLPRHEHTYEHLTLCNSGSLIVRKENRELVMNKDTQPVNLLANEWHEIEALEDETVFVNIFIEDRH